MISKSLSINRLRKMLTVKSLSESCFSTKKVVFKFQIFLSPIFGPRRLWTLQRIFGKTFYLKILVVVNIRTACGTHAVLNPKQQGVATTCTPCNHELDIVMTSKGSQVGRTDLLSLVTATVVYKFETSSN